MNKFYSQPLCLLLLAGLVFWIPPSSAQKRTTRPQGYYLPKASFPTYSRGPQDELPTMDGVHLDGGMTRKNDGLAQVYDPGEPDLNMQLVRWDVRRFPLRIWISEGKKLPDLPFDMLKKDRVDRVFSMLRANPGSIEALPEAPGWKPEMNETVANGFEQWRDLEKEGLISFGFVDDPRKANVLIFFVDRFQGAAGPGGTDVNGNTAGQVFTSDQVSRKLAQGDPPSPIVMELKVLEEYDKLQANAAHEFGHALGIKAHSPYREDIMFGNRQRTDVSPSDKATLRALYQKLPSYWYY